VEAFRATDGRPYKNGNNVGAIHESPEKMSQPAQPNQTNSYFTGEGALKEKEEQ